MRIAICIFLVAAELLLKAGSINLAIRGLNSSVYYRGPDRSCRTFRGKMRHVESIRTDSCIIAFSDPNCNGYSEKILPREVTRFHNVVDVASFQVCDDNNGGDITQVNVFDNNTLVAEYWDVCGCVNFDASLSETMSSLNNFGNCVNLYSMEECSGPKTTLIGGRSPQSDDLDRVRRHLGQIKSMSQCGLPVECIALNATIYRFVVDENDSQPIFKKVDLATTSYFNNSGRATVTKQYTVSKSIRQSYTVSKNIAFSRMNSVNLDAQNSVDFSKTQNSDNTREVSSTDGRSSSSSTSRGSTHSVSDSRGSSTSLQATRTEENSNSRTASRDVSNSRTDSRDVGTSDSSTSGHHTETRQDTSSSTTNEHHSEDSVGTSVSANAGFSGFGVSVGATVGADTRSSSGTRNSITSGFSHGSSSGSSHSTTSGRTENIGYSTTSNVNQGEASTQTGSRGQSQSSGSDQSQTKTNEFGNSRTSSNDNSQSSSNSRTRRLSDSQSFVSSLSQSLREAYTKSNDTSEADTNTYQKDEDQNFNIQDSYQIPPCEMYVVSSELEIVEKATIKYWTYVKVTGTRSGQFVPESELKHHVKDMDYVDRLDDRTAIFRSYNEVVVTDIGITAASHGFGYPIQECLEATNPQQAGNGEAHIAASAA